PSPPSAGSDASSAPSSPSSYIGKQHAPIVYPALLSKVADAFRSRMILTNRMKDNLEYKDCFDGREAVDRKLWIHTVLPEIANSVSETEKKRQEAINE
ncbi:6174_t:CDS:2, partial [Racocetra fulgida]